MQWLKQTFTVRYNLFNGWTGHIWGDRYWSRIAKGEPPDGVECWTDSVGEEDAEELSPAGGGGRLLSWRIKAEVRPLPGKPAKILRKAASPPAQLRKTRLRDSVRKRQRVDSVPASQPGRKVEQSSARMLPGWIASALRSSQ
jgi:hypothetical protein